MRYCLLILLLCLLLPACGEVAETTARTTAAPTPEATGIMTVQTTAEATDAPQTTTVPETTTVLETTAVPETTAPPVPVAVTTAAATKAPKKPKSPPVASVLDGEYTYNDGNAPIIETVDGFTYVNGILIANKTYSLPADYDPGALHPDTQAAFNEMRAAAAAEGLTLKIISGYRPYSQQKSTYNNYSARDGKELADRYSARPGHSEHQTGHAIDLNSLRQSFANTDEGIWIAEHCAEYGFILRYGKDKEEKTGFMYEPWHLRYLGKELAKAVTESGLCLEEFLGITSEYSE